MSLNKFLTIVLAVTLLSLVYVHQQNRIIQLAYQEQERLASFENLVDKHNNLRYNLGRQMSLVSIAGLWQEGDFEWPHRRQLVSLSSAGQAAKASPPAKQAGNIFTRLLELKSQAEATPVNPR
jgi:type II secretory pathway component PulJ